MKGKKILITAGPTREYWDPVRFLTNASSGEMGIHVANTLARQGAQVTLVMGPTSLTPHQSVKVCPVVSALEMSRQVKKRIASMDALIATAAVSDYRFEKRVPRKLKKNKPTLSVSLVKNPDILLEVGEWKKRKKVARPVLLGFALETDHIEQHALEKLRRKNCDVVIGNSPASFSSSQIKPVWVEKSGAVKYFPTMTKIALARRIAQWLISTLN